MFRQGDQKTQPQRQLESSAMAAMNPQAAVSSSSINPTETKEREEKHQQIDPDKVTIELTLNNFKCILTNNFFSHPVELGCGHVFECSALPSTPYFNCSICQTQSNIWSIAPVRNINFWNAYKQIFNQYPQLNKYRHYDIYDFYKTLINSVANGYSDPLRSNDNKNRLNRYIQLFLNVPDFIFQQGVIPKYAKPVNAVHLLLNHPQGKQLLDNYPQLKAVIKTGSRSRSGAVLAINPLNKEADKLIEYVKPREVKQEVPQEIKLDFDIRDFQCPITLEVLLEPLELDCGHLAEKSRIEKLNELKDNQRWGSGYLSEKCCPQCKVEYINIKNPNIISQHIISSAIAQNSELESQRYYNFEDFIDTLNEYKPSEGALPRLNAYVALFAKSPQLLHKAKNKDNRTFAELIVRHPKGSAFLNAHSDLKKTFVQQLSIFANPFDSDDDERINRFKSAVTSHQVKR